MTKSVVEILDEFQKTQGIDPRSVVFDYTVHEEEGRYQLDFYTSLPSVADEVERIFASVRVSVGNKGELKAHLLPDSSVGTNAFGLCAIGTASMYKSAGYRVEQASQLLINESFDILQRKDSWLRIRNHADGYLGWVNATQVRELDETAFKVWRAHPRVIARGLDVRIRLKPSGDAKVLRTAPFGSRLSVIDRRAGWLKVLLPDLTKGWIRSAETFPAKKRPGPLTGREMIRTAEMLLGSSYQWGGRSPGGFDCSGLIQMVYSVHGIQLPRDAGQQYLQGKNPGVDPAEFRPGDLLFFAAEGPVPTHVALYAGKKSMIHARGFVRYDDFEQRTPEAGGRSQEQFLGARRIAGIQH